jgi:hypothetical protein
MKVEMSAGPGTNEVSSPSKASELLPDTQARMEGGRRVYLCRPPQAGRQGQTVAKSLRRELLPAAINRKT